MNSSFLYHAWGLYSLECTREEYKGNTIILHVQSKKPQKKRRVHHNGQCTLLVICWKVSFELPFVECDIVSF